jgi:hypothetical protein
MLRPPARRSALLALAFTLVCVAATPSQAAEIIVSQPCNRYITGLAGVKFVPVQGAGFSPSTNPAFPNTVDLGYTNGDSGGFVNVTNTGLIAPGSAALMPSNFISQSAGRTKTYTLTATDSVNPPVTASTLAKFVRVGAGTKPENVRGNVRRRVRWTVWGIRSGARIYAHWTFRGKKRATRSLGRAKGSCGIARKRAPFLAARVRYGTWKVYFTAGKRFSRREFPYYVKLDISRLSFPTRAAASAATAARVR